MSSVETLTEYKSPKQIEEIHRLFFGDFNKAHPTNPIYYPLGGGTKIVETAQAGGVSQVQQVRPRVGVTMMIKNAALQVPKGTVESVNIGYYQSEIENKKMGRIEYEDAMFKIAPEGVTLDRVLQKREIMMLDLHPENNLSPFWWPTKVSDRDMASNKSGAPGMWARYGTSEILFNYPTVQAKFTRDDTAARDTTRATARMNDYKIQSMVYNLSQKQFAELYSVMVEDGAIAEVSPSTTSRLDVQKTTIGDYAVANYAMFKARYYDKVSLEARATFKAAFIYNVLHMDGGKIMLGDKELYELPPTSDMIGDEQAVVDWMVENVTADKREYDIISKSLYLAKQDSKKEKTPELTPTGTGTPPRDRP